MPTFGACGTAGWAVISKGGGEEAGLYLRHSIRRKNGTTHTYWRLVRSVRRGGKVVQETVAQLDELDAQGRASARLCRPGPRTASALPRALQPRQS
jgi:hypothetical protein